MSVDLSEQEVGFSGFIVKEGSTPIFIMRIFQDDPLVLNEIREDLRVECSKFGQIRKLLLFDVSSWLGHTDPEAVIPPPYKFFPDVSIPLDFRLMFL